MEEDITAKMQNITNVVSGLSYRVAIVEEKTRDHLTVQIEHTDSHQVPNVMIYAPTEPTATIHLPQANLLADLYNQIAWPEPAPSQALRGYSRIVILQPTGCRPSGLGGA
jgi:hypothetical protein